VRVWAAADLRAELVELFALLLDRTDHLVAPLDWDRADPPPIPLKLHGRYARAEVFAAFGPLNEARPFPGRGGGPARAWGGAAARTGATGVSGRTMDVHAGKPMDTAGTRARDRRIEIRATAEDRQLIDRAVAASGTDLTGFVITHLRLAAQQVLADREEFRLEPEALEAWERINHRPARSLKGLRALMDRPSPFQE